MRAWSGSRTEVFVNQTEPGFDRVFIARFYSSALTPAPIGERQADRVLTNKRNPH
jgi:hypothetical protein